MENTTSINKLTSQEQFELHGLEQTIEAGLKTFMDVGTALLAIREKKLYRQKYATFEAYCQDRWGMVASRARQLISASETVSNLKSVTNVTLLPTNEAQARPLMPLDPKQQQEAWTRALEIAPKDDNGQPKITGKIVEQAVQETNGFNYKRDMRRTSIQDIYTPLGMDACQTPAYAIDPLLPYLYRFKTIWEPASGEGLLVEALYDAGFEVESSDLIDGTNFFEYEPYKWDCIVTNPPYSIKYKWLERCYELEMPFALLLPVDTIGAKTAQELFEKHGIEIMLLNRRVNFKMPNKGWDAAGAPFSTAWFTWGLNLGRQLTFGKIEYPDE